MAELLEFIITIWCDSSSSSRHLGHRSEINRGEVGLREHFNKHMKENNWDIDQVTEYFI